MMVQYDSNLISRRRPIMTTTMTTTTMTTTMTPVPMTMTRTPTNTTTVATSTTTTDDELSTGSTANVRMNDEILPSRMVMTMMRDGNPLFQQTPTPALTSWSFSKDDNDEKRMTMMDYDHHYHHHHHSKNSSSPTSFSHSPSSIVGWTQRQRFMTQQEQQRQQTRSFSSQPPNNNNNNNSNANLGNIFQQMMNPSNGGQSYLEQYTVELTELVRRKANNKNKKDDNKTDGNKNNNNTSSSSSLMMIDPIIGRHDEIHQCLQILGRRRKNNPILIGPAGAAGVGKTAIAEGLAQRMVMGQSEGIPDSLKNKRVLSLDISSLMAGTMMRGQMEERLKGIIQEIQQSHGEIILFIDEIHTILGTGGGGGSPLDIGNILKPALARGELQLLGATTLDEYRTMEKDTALVRRFQTVYVNEPNPKDTLSILRGLKSHYELHHSGIRIQDEALVAAVELSN